MHVKGNVDKILGDLLADDVALLIGGVFQQLLAQVVAKMI
jgi:hypothetical protein